MSNLTASMFGGQGPGNVRAEKGINSGKVYWEVAFDGPDSLARAHIGITDSSQDLSTILSGDNTYFIDTQSGQVFNIDPTQIIDVVGNQITVVGAAGLDISTSGTGNSSIRIPQGSYVEVADSDDFEYGSDDFTIEFFFKLNSFQGDVGNSSGWHINALLSQYESNNDRFGIHYHSPTSSLSNNIAVFWTNGGNQYDYDTPVAPLNLNQWYHFAAVRTGNSVAVYIDGVSQGSDSPVGIAVPNISAPLRFGRDDLDDGGNPNEFEFDGWIDGIRITSGLARYTSNFTPTTSIFPESGDTSSDFYFNAVTAILPFNDNFDDLKGNAVSTFNGPVINNNLSRFGGGSLELPTSSTNQIVVIGTNLTNALIGDNAFCVDAWVYPDSTKDGGVITSWGSTSDLNNRFRLFSDIGGGNLIVQFDNNVNNTITVPNGLINNQWNHVAIAVDHNNVVQIYTNGIKRATSTAAVYRLGEFRIGAHINNTFPQEGFEHIDEFRITKNISRYGNFEEIVQPLPERELDPDFDKVTLLLPLQDYYGDSRDFNDQSSFNNDVTINGVVMSNSQALFGGQSALWDSTLDSIELDDSEIWEFGTDDFTIEARVWFNTLSGAFDTPTIICQYNGTASQSNFWLGISSVGSNPLRLILSSGSTNFSFDSTLNRSDFNTNQWYHIAVTRENGSLEFWVDGQPTGLVGSPGNQGVAPNNSSLPLLVGKIFNSTIFTLSGHMQDVRITRGLARYRAVYGEPSQAFGQNTTSDPFFDNVTLLLDFENGFADSSNSNNMVTSQTATISNAQARFGGFSGLFVPTDTITFANDSDFDFGTGDYTIEYWVYPTSTADFRHILDARSTTGAATWNTTFSPTSTLTYALNGVGYETSPVALNQWHHFAVSRQNGIVRLFLNGNLEVSDFNPANATGPNSTLFIGRAQNTASGVFAFDGHLDEVRITKGVARYVDSFPNLLQEHSNLINSSSVHDQICLSLHFNDTDGSTTTTDSSEFASDNTITFIGNAEIDTAQARFGSSSLFTTAGGLSISNPNGYNLDSNDFTLEMFIRWNGDDTNIMHLFELVDSYRVLIDPNFGGNQILLLSRWDSNLGPTGVYTSIINENITIIQDTWHHIAVTRDGNIFRLFIDGEHIGDGDIDTNTFESVSGPLLIGYTTANSTQYFKGHIDDVRVTKGSAQYSFNLPPRSSTFTDGDDNFGSVVFLTNAEPATDPVSVEQVFPGDIVNFALDADAGNIWIGVNGTYANNGDPGLDVSPTQSGLVGEIFPFVGSADSISDWQATANFGQSVFVSPVPTGYAPGFSDQGTLALQNFNLTADGIGSVEVDQNVPVSEIQRTYLEFNIESIDDCRVIGFGVDNGTESTYYLSDGRLGPFNKPVDICDLDANLESNESNDVDPFFNNVTFLLNFESGFNDLSNFNNVPNTNTASLENTIVQFGERSGDFPQASSRMIYPNTDAFMFGTGDFTIEYWLYPITTTGSTQIIFDTRNNTGTLPWQSAMRNDQTMQFVTSLGSYSTVGTVNLNEWSHFAASRKNGILKLFLNGVEEFSVVDASAVNGGNSNFFIGKGHNTVNSSPFNWRGFLDDIRFTKGVARYTSSFAVPTQPHPVIGPAENSIDVDYNSVVALVSMDRDDIDFETDVTFDSSDLELDRLYDNTTIIVKFDDPNFPDQSSAGKTVSTNTRQQISTVTRFGVGALDMTQSGNLRYTGSDQLLGTGDWTIEFWFYPIALPAVREFFGSTSGSTGTTIGLQYETDGTIRISNSIFSQFGVGSTTPVNLNEWNFISFVRSGSQIRGHVNGQNPGGTNSTQALTATELRWDGDVTGYIDEIRFTSGIARYPVAGNYTPPNNPFGLEQPGFPFENVDKIVDKSQNNFNYNIEGEARLVYDTAKFSTTSLECNAQGDYVISDEASEDFQFGTGDFTVECWYYEKGLGDNPPLVSTGWDDPGRWTFHSELTGDGLSFWSRDKELNSSTGLVVSTGRLPANRWHHVAVTREGGTTRLFANGSLEDTSTFAYDITSTVLSELAIGHQPFRNTRWFDGRIRDVRVTKGIARYTSDFVVKNYSFNETRKRITWNENDQSVGFDLLNDNLTTIFSGTQGILRSNQGKSSGKWYWEIEIIQDDDISACVVGAVNGLTSTNIFQFGNDGAAYRQDGVVDGDGGTVTGLPPYTADDVISIALDLDNLMVWFAKNGTYIQGSPLSGTGGFALSIDTDIIFPAVGDVTGTSSSIQYKANFGNSPFRYNIPPGFYQYDLTLPREVQWNYQSFPRNGVLFNNQKTVISQFVSDSEATVDPFDAVAGTSLLLHFDENLDDSSSNTLVGSASGSAQLVSDPVISGSQALQLGSGNFVSYPSVSGHYFGSNDFTVEAFVYLVGNGNFGSIVSTWNGTNGSSWLINYRNDLDEFHFFAADFNPADPVITTSGIYNSSAFNQWLHVAVTRESGTNRIFVNGNQENENTISYNITNGAGTRNIEIGRQAFSPSRFVDGFVDNIRIVNGTALYTKSFKPLIQPNSWQGRANEGKLSGKWYYEVKYDIDGRADRITMNPEDAADDFDDAVFTQENMRIDVDFDSNSMIRSTQPVITGNLEKKYFEVEINNTDVTLTPGQLIGVGVSNGTADPNTTSPGELGSGGIVYVNDGRVRVDSTFPFTGPSFTTGDVIGVAVDLATRDVWFSKNGVYIQGDPETGSIPSGTYASATTELFICVGYIGTVQRSVDFTVNVGQEPFNNAPPNGFEQFDDFSNSGGVPRVGVSLDGPSGPYFSRLGRNSRTWSEYEHNSQVSSPNGSQTLNQSDIRMIAVDLDNGAMWVGTNGVWEGDPETGLNPQWSNLPTGSELVYPAIGNGANNQNFGQMTSYFGISDLKFAPPNRYLPWDIHIDPQHSRLPTYASGDTVGVAINPNLPAVWFSKNNDFVFGHPNGNLQPTVEILNLPVSIVHETNGSVVSANFGDSAFDQFELADHIAFGCGNGGFLPPPSVFFSSSGGGALSQESTVLTLCNEGTRTVNKVLDTSDGNQYLEIEILDVSSQVAIGVFESGFYSDGRLCTFASGCSTVQFPQLEVGDIFNIALRSNGQAFFGINGTYFFNGNPVAGTNATTTFTNGNRLFVGVYEPVEESGIKVRLNGGVKDFTNSMPAGYSEFDSNIGSLIGVSCSQGGGGPTVQTFDSGLQIVSLTGLYSGDLAEMAQNEIILDIELSDKVITSVTDSPLLFDLFDTFEIFDINQSNLNNVPQGFEADRAKFTDIPLEEFVQGFDIPDLPQHDSLSIALNAQNIRYAISFISLVDLYTTAVQTRDDGFSISNVPSLFLNTRQVFSIGLPDTFGAPFDTHSVPRPTSQSVSESADRDIVTGSSDKPSSLITGSPKEIDLTNITFQKFDLAVTEAAYQVNTGKAVIGSKENLKKIVFLEPRLAEIQFGRIKGGPTGTTR